DTAAHQFRGFSDQNLRLFILDLKTGNLLRTIDTGIQNAFGGSLYNASMDYDLDYQDDAIYLGYTQSEVANPTNTTQWTQGGVIRLITREDLHGNNITVTGDTALNPNNWLWSYVAKDIGTVTSAVAKLASYPNSFKGTAQKPTEGYLYFGTGRYFYNTTAQVDDSTSQRRIFGIKEPCLGKILSIDDLSDPVCDGTSLSCSLIGSGDLATSDLLGAPQCISEATTSAGTNDTDGWYINLDPSSITVFAERDITDPVAAGYYQTVYFTTFIPSRDVCAFGGSTSLWAVDWKTGGSVSLTGKALLQVSTGAILELDLATVFSLRDNRKTPGMQGVPPYGSGLTLIIPPAPSKIILDIRKK
ncbi:MAG: hypothetical protein LLG05_07035, partial [Porphyromonadaceae bacterium]|nr:hypothetical protein [Porphyromonadaceae bacterium]